MDTKEPSPNEENIMDRFKDYVREQFKSYTDKYDMSDAKINLKAYHTYKVAELCEDIAKSIGLDEMDVLIAWISGMLHDIGRFEQVRRYGTFFDGQSVDHAQFGADLLFKEGLYETIVPYLENETKEEYLQKRELIEKAIRVHNVFRMPPDMSEREKMFADILRDADKVDILRANCDTPTEQIYNTTLEELKNSEVSEDTKIAFKEKRCAKRHDKTSLVDHIVGHVCFVFELVYPRSVQLAFEQGYLFKLIDFESNIEATNKWFEYMRQELEKMRDEVLK